MSSIFHTLFDEIKLSHWHHKLINTFSIPRDIDIVNNLNSNVLKSNRTIKCLSLPSPLKGIPITNARRPSEAEIRGSMITIKSWIAEIQSNGNRPTDCLLQFICSFCDLYGILNHPDDTNITPIHEEIVSFLIAVRSYLKNYLATGVNKEKEIMKDEPFCDISPVSLAIDIKKLCKDVMLNALL